MSMATYKGPCVTCGVYIERKVKTGRKMRCIECALAAQRAQQRGYAEGTDPAVAKSYAAGDAVGKQIRARKGPAFEKWARSMAAYASSLTTTEGETSDTVPG